MYRLTHSNSILRLSDGAFIPAAPANTDYQHYLAWVAGGNAPEPAPVPVPDAAAVNAERDRRLNGDFTFNGVLFQRDPTSLRRITGAATLAGFAIANGAQPGNLRWANPDRDFLWIASDNSLVPLDAQTCFAFGQAAANVETSLIFAAQQLRATNPIPADYTDDKWWP